MVQQITFLTKMDKEGADFDSTFKTGTGFRLC